jgi:hypothetical protein
LVGTDENPRVTQNPYRALLLLKRVGGNVDAGAGLSVAGLGVPISTVGKNVKTGSPALEGEGVKAVK